MFTLQEISNAANYVRKRCYRMIYHRIYHRLQRRHSTVAQAPFDGMKEGGHQGLEEYLEEKYISMDF